jgi:hypothetical protein
VDGSVVDPFHLAWSVEPSSVCAEELAPVPELPSSKTESFIDEQIWLGKSFNVYNAPLFIRFV